MLEICSFFMHVSKISLFQSLKLVCDGVNQLFGLFPAQAWVCDGLSVNAFTNLLCTIFNIAFNHEALEQLPDVIAVTAAMQHFVANPNLFQILLAGICMVCIDNDSRICKFLLVIQFAQIR